jgi:ribosomal protein L11 methyltransferase
MPWKQITLIVPADEAEAAEGALTDLGALSITCTDDGDNPVLEPALGTTPLWTRTRVTGLFEARLDTGAALKQLFRQLGNRLPPDRVLAETLDDQDWERAWLEYFKPIRFGQRLQVCPWHLPAETHPGEVVLRLDPGLAFGTGTHPTTALCLDWLSREATPGLNVCDYGCGSGILAIAAALLGARHVDAVDHDPQALEATCDNARRNHVAEGVRTYLPADFSGSGYDLVLANILAEPLVELAPALSDLVKPGGRIALSGLLTEQADWVSAAYQKDFEMETPTVQDGWVRLDGRKKARPTTLPGAPGKRVLFNKPASCKSSLPRQVGWGVLCLPLLCLLAFQVLYFNGMALLDNHQLQQLRPVYEHLPRAFRPGFQDADRILIQQAALRALDSDRYELAFRISNPAPLPQPLPDLVFRFDPGGNLEVIEDRLAPWQYLHRPVSPDETLGPHRSRLVRVWFEPPLPGPFAWSVHPAY